MASIAQIEAEIDSIKEDIANGEYVRAPELPPLQKKLDDARNKKIVAVDEESLTCVAIEMNESENKRKQAEARQREFDGATHGSEHDDQALPTGTVLFLGQRRGLYQAFEKYTFGANGHTVKFDDGGTETLRLKEKSDWRFVRS